MFMSYSYKKHNVSFVNHNRKNNKNSKQCHNFLQGEGQLCGSYWVVISESLI